MSNAPVPEPSLAQSRTRWLTGAGLLAGGQVVVLFVGAVATILLARTLRPAGFGTYSVLSVCVSLATLVAVFGLDTHLITQLSGRTDDRRPYGWDFRLCAEITTALCIPAVVLVLATTHGVVRVASLVAVVELCLTPFLLGRSVLLAQMRQGGVAGANIANRLALLAGVLIVMLLHVSPPLVWMMVISGLAVAVEVVVLGALAGTPMGWMHRLQHRRRQLLAASWPLAAASIAGALYVRLDQLLLAAFRGQREVGIYAVAVNLATALGIVSSVVYAATLPGVIEACNEGQEGSARRVVEDMALLMFVPGGLGIAVLAGAGGKIIPLLFGRAYPNAHALVAVLAFAELWVFAGTVLMAVLIGVDRRRVLFTGVVAALGVMVILDLLLLQRYGAIAAAWASLVSYAIAVIVPAFLAPEAFSIARPAVKALVKVAVAAALGAAAAFAFHSLPLAFVIAVATYLAATATLFSSELRRVQRYLAQRRALRHS
jgi:PST family polysaccharide transporter